MAQQVNQVVLGGNLVRDPELRHLPTGTAVCSMRVANNRRAKIDGEWTERPGFFDVTVWGAQGEACAQYLEKGRPVVVVGELRFREWEQDGHKRSAVDINAREVQFIGGRDDGRERTGQSDIPADEDFSTAPPSGGSSYDDDPDSDIPFAFEEVPDWEELKARGR